MYNQLLNMAQHNDDPFLVGTDSYYLLACHWEGTVARFSFSLSTLEGQIVQIKLAKSGLTHNWLQAIAWDSWWTKLQLHMG